MGTPAFPDLGKHCSVEDCRLIDFLPFTCDCCQQVYCLEHRSYSKHQCKKANKNDVTVVICPLCAKGVRLNPEEDPNITWESHVNTDCDPSNFEQATKKRKCPVPRCKERLTFSNTVKCRDCSLDHCLKHRFGPDHSCPPKKLQAANDATTSPSMWAWSFLKVGMERLSNEFNQALGVTAGVQKCGSTGNSVDARRDQVKVCTHCKLRFSGVGALMEHVREVHEKNGVMKVTLDVCPKCSKGFRDPVKLVEHVEKEHKGASKA